MIICDRCGKPNASKTYVTVATASSSTYELQSQADLCGDCRVDLAGMIDEALEPLPKPRRVAEGDPSPK